MALAAALCLGAAIYTTAPKGEGESTYTASAEGFDSDVTVTMTISGGKVTGVESLAGRGCWTEEIGGRVMRLTAPSFFQVNTPGAEELVRLVMEGLEPDGSDIALDLYSGAGTFTLPLAEASYDTVAVESAGSSVRDLRYNLEHNGLDAEVIGGDVGRELPELGYADVAVVDPPRSGLAPEALKALLDTRARRIAYVSCDPTTLARDLKAVLADGRYRIHSVQPVDLFPQTYRVETVVLMSKVGVEYA